MKIRKIEIAFEVLEWAFKNGRPIRCTNPLPEEFSLLEVRISPEKRSIELLFQDTTDIEIEPWVPVFVYEDEGVSENDRK